MRKGERDSMGMIRKMRTRGNENENGNCQKKGCESKNYVKIREQDTRECQRESVWESKELKC